jgi:hypothetical protein
MFNGAPFRLLIAAMSERNCATLRALNAPDSLGLSDIGYLPKKSWSCCRHSKPTCDASFYWLIDNWAQFGFDARVTVRIRRLCRPRIYDSAAIMAFLDPADWATWFGEDGNDSAAAKAGCKTTRRVYWTMTKEERAPVTVMFSTGGAGFASGWAARLDTAKSVISRVGRAERGRITTSIGNTFYDRRRRSTLCRTKVYPRADLVLHIMPTIQSIGFGMGL